MDGLLWAAIRDHPSLLDEVARTQLGKRSLATRSHAAALWTTLMRYADVLAQLGIDVATFKGVTAEARWYDQLGDRPCGDVDLLLAPYHHHRIGELVAALEPQHPLAADVDALVAAGELQSIELRVDGIEIDLHLDLFKLGIPSRQREAIWDRTLQLSTPDGDVRVLDPETALVHFLLHLNKDRFRWLLGYVDVAHLLQRDLVDWSAVRAIAAADGLDDVVALSLECVTDLLELEVVGWPVPRGWRTATWRRLWAHSVRLQGDVAVSRFHLRQAALPVLARGRGADALRYLARRLVPEPRLVRYNNPTSSGGYVRRLTTGRLARSRARRREVRRLRKVARSSHTRAATSTRATG